MLSDDAHFRLDTEGWNFPIPETPEGYLIRTYRQGDDIAWERVMKKAGFELAFWGQRFSSFNMETDFDPEGFFFAEKDGEVVGSSSGVIMHSRGNIGCVGWTAVLPEHQKKGLGTILVARSTDFLKRKGVKTVEVKTQLGRGDAIHVYKKIGFKRV